MFRMLLACAIVFAAVPALLFPAFPSKDRMERMVGNALFMGALTVVMMHVFVLLKINDNIAIVTISLWMIGLKWWTMVRRKDVGIILVKSVLLRWIEIFSHPSIGKRSGLMLSGFWKKESALRLGLFAAFIAICAGAIVMRIGPIWNHSAPLSPEYYETLEQVKRLQINQESLDLSRIPMGMPMIISALCTASQINPTIAVHYFGLISALLLCASLYYCILAASRSHAAAALGTAVFAWAYALLPVSVNHQIEADSLTLAAVFLLPALSFFMNYIAKGDRAHLFASLSGLAACALINLFAGCVGLIAAAVIAVASFFILPFISRLRGRALALHAAFAAVLSAAAISMWFYAQHSDAARNLLNVIFYDTHFYRYAPTDTAPDQSFLMLCAGMFLALIAAAFVPRSRKDVHVHLMGWGFAGILLLALMPPFSLGLPNIIPTAETVFIAGAAASLAIGLCAGIMFDALQWLLRAMRLSGLSTAAVRSAAGICTLAAVCVVFRGAPAAVARTAEPDAFVRNLYVIERTFIPYQWTIVAHRGILLAGMNRGRFLDYDYFTSMYDPLTYLHGKPGSIPTALVFIFIEKHPEASEISSEIASLNKDAMVHAGQWCETYMKTHSDMTVFYSDEKVIIYQLRDPNVASLRV
jgi:hypothetical protein